MTQDEFIEELKSEIDLLSDELYEEYNTFKTSLPDDEDRESYSGVWQWIRYLLDCANL
jgi:hypothetical protein